MIRAYPKALPIAERTPGNLVEGSLLYDKYEDQYFIFDSARCSIEETRCSGDYCIKSGLIEIAIETAAEFTGRLDRHGDKIFGSKGAMQGGDLIQGCTTDECREVSWDEQELTWVVTTQYGTHSKIAALSKYDTTGHEIVPPLEKGAE